MTETRLRTRTHAFAYAATGLCFLTAALVNLRFGFYELFFTALIVLALSAAGIVYTAIMREQQLRAGGHLWILALIGLTAVGATASHGENALLWLYPLVFLNLMVLRLRGGLILSAALILLTVPMLYPTPAYELLSAYTGLALLTGAAGWFAYRYHYSARFVDTLTIIDPETGAYNLRCFDETLAKEISRSEATGHPLSLACLSVDYMEELRELHGEASLKPLLRAISDRLGNTMRAGDSLYYAGRGCFYLLLPFTHEEGLRVITERLRRVIDESHWPVAESISACIGCTTRADGETSPNSLTGRCQDALAEARKRGHDQIWHLK